MTNGQFLSGYRADKAEKPGVHLQSLPVLVPLSIPGIAEDGAADGFEMTADLVEAARPQSDIDFRNVFIPIEGDDLEIRPGCPAVQGEIDGALFTCGSRAAQDFYPVALLNRPLPEEAGRAAAALFVCPRSTSPEASRSRRWMR